jgi:hypothetical protein
VSLRSETLGDISCHTSKMTAPAVLFVLLHTSCAVKTTAMRPAEPHEEVHADCDVHTTALHASLATAPPCWLSYSSTTLLIAFKLLHCTRRISAGESMEGAM